MLWHTWTPKDMVTTAGSLWFNPTHSSPATTSLTCTQITALMSESPDEGAYVMMFCNLSADVGKLDFEISKRNPDCELHRVHMLQMTCTQP